MPHRHAKSMPHLRPSFNRAPAHCLSVAAPFFDNRRRQLAALATRHGVPAIADIREFVVAGGLMSYGASDTDAYRRAGSHYVARILKGAKPGDLPVEMPSKYELVVNVVVAKALGLDIPPKLLALRRRGDRISWD